MHRRDNVVERIDHKRERHATFVLGSAPDEHKQLRTPGQLAGGYQQRALADPSLTQHAQRAALASPHVGNGLRKSPRLRVAAKKVHRRFRLNLTIGPVKHTAAREPNFQ